MTPFKLLCYSALEYGMFPENQGNTNFGDISSFRQSSCLHVHTGVCAFSPQNKKPKLLLLLSLALL